MSPAIAILGFALLMLIGGSIATYIENKADKSTPPNKTQPKRLAS